MNASVRRKTGKVAIVTGAAQGIGRAFAMRLAEEGATVVAIDVAHANTLQEELVAVGAPQAAVLRLDVADEEAVAGCAADVVERFGRCDILVNNAGILRHAGLADVTLADWRRIMAVNVDAMFLLCRALVPGMAERSWGRVVNLASDMLNSVAVGFSPYFASKGAVVGFTRALANEFGPQGVTANCIAPGFTRTPRTEEEVGDQPIFDIIAKGQAIKRTGMPEDLVGAMSFLTSDDAGFLTGQTLIVNGGMIKAL